MVEKKTPTVIAAEAAAFAAATETAKGAIEALKEIAGDSMYPSGDRVAAATELLAHYRHFYG